MKMISVSDETHHSLFLILEKMRKLNPSRKVWSNEIIAILIGFWNENNVLFNDKIFQLEEKPE